MKTRKYSLLYKLNNYNNNYNIQLLNSMGIDNETALRALHNLTLSTKDSTTLYYFIYPAMLGILAGMIFWLNSEKPITNTVVLVCTGILFTLDVIVETLSNKTNARVLNYILDSQLNTCQNKFIFKANIFCYISITPLKSDNNKSKENNTEVEDNENKQINNISNNNVKNINTITNTNRDSFLDVIPSKKSNSFIGNFFIKKSKSISKINNNDKVEYPTIERSIYLKLRKTANYDMGEYCVNENITGTLSYDEIKIINQFNEDVKNFNKQNCCATILITVVGIIIVGGIIAGGTLVVVNNFPWINGSADNVSAIIVSTAFALMTVFIVLLLCYLRKLNSSFKIKYEDTLKRNYRNTFYYLSFNSGKNIYLHKVNKPKLYDQKNLQRINLAEPNNYKRVERHPDLYDENGLFNIDLVGILVNKLEEY